MDCKRAILAAALVAGFGGLGVRSTVAQETPKKPENARFGTADALSGGIYKDYIYGMVKSITTNEIVLDKTKFGFDQTYKLDPKATKVVRDGKPSALDTIKVGEPVYVEPKKDKKSGDMIAKKILAGIVETKLP
jgi:hypothetical protein